MSGRAEHFQQCAEFLPLRNRGLGPLAVTVLSVAARREGRRYRLRRRAIDTACAPASGHRARKSEQILRHVIGRIRRNWPAVEIMVRGDSHFATPEVMDLLESMPAKHGA